MKLLKEIFLYFAKYPSREALDKLFTLTSDSAEYKKLKDEAMTAALSKFPQISDYIFGVNEESVTRRISNVSGFYLFVDYGNIVSAENKNGVKSDTFNIAITIAKPLSSTLLDQAQELLISDEALNILTKIRKDLRTDDKNSFIDWLEFPHEITPFFARELSNSYGWTLLFKINGIDMI